MRKGGTPLLPAAAPPAAVAVSAAGAAPKAALNASISRLPGLAGEGRTDAGGLPSRLGAEGEEFFRRMKDAARQTEQLAPHTECPLWVCAPRR